MRSIGKVLEELQARSNCVFKPGNLLPSVPEGLRLPRDVATFYSRFSEARLFEKPGDSRYRIVRPAEFVPIGQAILGRASCVPLQYSWFALADVLDGNYLAIDCDPDRLGYCYDAFHETIERLDYCKVIARSFTELMNRALEAGDEAWWLGERFETCGYADRLVGDSGDQSSSH